jgi:hypothetical protein
MRRSLGLALAIVMVLPVGADAQSPSPEPWTLDAAAEEMSPPEWSPDDIPDYLADESAFAAYLVMQCLENATTKLPEGSTSVPSFSDLDHCLAAVPLMAPDGGWSWTAGPDGNDGPGATPQPRLWLDPDEVLCFEYDFNPNKISRQEFGDEAKLTKALKKGWVTVIERVPCNAAPTPQPTPKPTPRKTPRPTPKPKTLTTYRGDPDLSFRWLESNEFKCSYGEACWGMIWKADKTCDSLYVELQYLDRNEVVVDRGIQSTSLDAGQSAKLVFETFDSSVRKARLHDVTCLGW